VIRLGQADLEGVVRFLGEAATLDGPEAFPRSLLAELRRLVPCDSVGYSELDRVHKERIWGEQEPEPKVDTGSELFQGYWRLRHEHPVCHYHEATGDFRALKLSDFVTRRELRSREIYSEWFRPWGVEHEMTVGLEAPPWHTKVFLFDRGGGRDFDERDRAILDLLRPYLQRLHRAAETRRRADAALAELERTEQAVVLLDRAGGIDAATPAAARLLAGHLGEVPGRLPGDVADWWRQALSGETMTIDGREGSLLLHAIRGGLLLEERPAHGLTAREREILGLVGEGKTNAEIAAALWISPGTVRRHLENAYAKLGVHTRTAAVAHIRRTVPAR
jgi:DNA-binding CsgD family transcriptional regulator